MMGYDGQTLTIEDTSRIDGSSSPPAKSSTPSPWTGVEYEGGVLGDTLGIKDYNLVSNVYKTDSSTYGSNGLKAYNLKSAASAYWLASRLYYYVGDTYYGYKGWFFDENGELGYSSTYAFFRVLQTGSWKDKTNGFPIRPIITLKKSVKIIDGSGTKNDPHILSK